jgi:osmotically-inducible protein OsmY
MLQYRLNTEEDVESMKAFTHWAAITTLVAVAITSGCSQTAKSPDVFENIRRALDQAGLKKVSVNQDRDKGVITLGGHVAGDGEKTHAEDIAKSVAGGQVVAGQIAVIPPGAEREAKAVNSDLDRGIEVNLDAALIQSNLHDYVKYAVKNHVVTLTGEVDSQSKRREAAAVAGSVPNVQQVVNELQVKNQKASSSE